MVAEAVFTRAEEVERILMVPWDMAEKVAMDFFREGWVEEPGKTISWAGSEEVLEHMDGEGVVVEEEGTLEGAVEVMHLIPVVVEVDPSMLERIRIMNVVTTQLVMVR